MIHTWSSVLEGEVLIFEFVSVDRFATSAVVVCEVTTLAHEVGDDTVEGAALVTKTLFTGAEGTEVFSCFWDYIIAEL